MKCEARHNPYVQVRLPAPAGGTYRGDTKESCWALEEMGMNEYSQVALQADVEAYFEALVRELEVASTEPARGSDRVAA